MIVFPVWVYYIFAIAGVLLCARAAVEIYDYFDLKHFWPWLMKKGGI